MERHLALLGFKVKDTVTGTEGVVTSISFELFGCVQALVDPGNDKDGKPRERFWFDEKRLKKVGKTPVMKVPTFDTVPGGTNLPGYTSQPTK